MMPMAVCTLGSIHFDRNKTAVILHDNNFWNVETKSFYLIEGHAGFIANPSFVVSEDWHDCPLSIDEVKAGTAFIDVVGTCKHPGQPLIRGRTDRDTEILRTFEYLQEFADGFIHPNPKHHCYSAAQVAEMIASRSK